MQVMTKHYVEMYFPKFSDNKCTKIESYKSVVKTISERNPLALGNDGICAILVTHFRYFDQTEAILDDGEVLCGQRKNYSPMYYCGKRLNKNDIRELGECWENFCQEKGYDSAIKCYSGDVLIFNPEEESITIDELQEKTNGKVKVLS